MKLSLTVSSTMSRSLLMSRVFPAQARRTSSHRRRLRGLYNYLAAAKLLQNSCADQCDRLRALIIIAADELCQ